MKDEIKCFLFSMGLGFAIGAMVTAKNKKVAQTAIKAEEMVMEKLEQAKEGLGTIKEKIQEKIEESEEEKNGSSQTSNNSKKASKSKKN